MIATESEYLDLILLILKHQQYMKGKKCSSNKHSNADRGMRYIKMCENGCLNKNPSLKTLNRTGPSQNTLKRMKENK